MGGSRADRETRSNPKMGAVPEFVPQQGVFPITGRLETMSTKSMAALLGEDSSRGWSQMASLPVVAGRYILALAILLVSASGTLRAAEAEGPKGDKAQDEKLLREISLPSDPQRGPGEEYFDRFVIRTLQRQTFVGAYWREQGSLVLQAIDIFAVERTPKGLVGRRVHSERLGGSILALHLIDLDTDGRDDLLFVHNTGGMVATTGVTLLRQTATGFSKAFFYAGTDVLIYRYRGHVRILVKASSSKEVEEFKWNPSKKTFEVTGTFELLY